MIVRTQTILPFSNVESHNVASNCRTEMAPHVRNTIIALETNESTWIRIDKSSELFERIKVENWVDASFTGFCIQSSQTVHCFTSTSRYSIHNKSTTHEVRMCHIWLMSLYSCSAKRNNKTNENPIVHCCSSRWIRAESSQQRNAETFCVHYFYCKFDQNNWQRCCKRFLKISSNWKQHNSLSYKMCKFRRLHSKYRQSTDKWKYLISDSSRPNPIWSWSVKWQPPNFCTCFSFRSSWHSAFAVTSMWWLLPFALNWPIVYWNGWLWTAKRRSEDFN